MFKYLGIPQANRNHEEATRKSALDQYLHRVRQALKVQSSDTPLARGGDRDKEAHH